MLALDETSRDHLKLLQMMRGTQMSEPNFMTIYDIVVNTFQLKPQMCLLWNLAKIDESSCNKAIKLFI